MKEKYGYNQMEFSDETLLPRRPYLFRAFYDWIIDNELTPLIVVDATIPGVHVPKGYIKDAKIVLNIALASVGNYRVDNQCIEFNARFNGILEPIYIPMSALEAIYARENGAGLGFSPEPHYDLKEGKTDIPVAAKIKPAFRVVK